MTGNNKENTMKTKHGFLFGFAVIAIAAMFTLAGCPTEDDGGGPGTDPGTGAALTITGLAAHNGKYVIADDNTSSEITGVYRLIAAASSMSSNSSVTGVKIENGQAVLKVYNYQGGGDPTLAYTGSDQNVSLRVFVKASNPFDVKGTGNGEEIGSVKVNFSSGSGTAALTAINRKRCLVTQGCQARAAGFYAPA
jgi:hypothetical protein